MAQVHLNTHPTTHPKPSQQPTHPTTKPYPQRLRDDARKAPDVISYLKAENDYTEAVLADTKELQVGRCCCFEGGVRVLGLGLGGGSWVLGVGDGKGCWLSFC